MKNKIIFTVLSVVCLSVCISCDSSSIMNLGNGMNKFGKPVYHTNIPDDDIKQISDIIVSLSDYNEEDESGQQKRDLVDAVQKIRKSGFLVGELQSMLDVELDVSETEMQFYLNETKGFSFIGDIALHPAEKVNQLLEKVLNPISESLEEFIKSEDSDFDLLLESLSEALGIEVTEDLAMVFIMLGPMIIEGVVEDTIMNNVVPYIEPYHGLITEIMTAQSIIRQGIESGNINKRLLACASVNDAFISDLFSMASSFIPQKAEDSDEAEINQDALVQAIGRMVSDLDTLSVLDSRIRFDSIDSLVSSIGFGEDK